MSMYTSLEDKWYSFLDSLEAKGIHVYKVIDPIDKVVPSFALFLAIIAIIVIGILWLLLPVSSQSSVSFKVVDEQGNALTATEVVLSYSGVERTVFSDLSGNISEFSVPIGTEVTIEVEKEGYTPYKKTVLADLANFFYEIVLESESGPEEYVVTIARSDGSVLLENASIDLSCTNSAVIPSPSHIETDKGFFTVTAPKNCGTLIARVSAQGFELSAGNAVNGNITISLQEVFSETGEIRVRVFEENVRVTETDFYVSIREEDSDLEYDSGLTRGGERKFEDVETGEYYAVVTDETGKYGTVKSENFEVKKNQLKTVDVKVSREVRARLEVIVKDLETGEEVEDAKITVLDSEGKVYGNGDTGKEAKKIVIPFHDLGNYTLIVENPEYLVFEEEFEIVQGIDKNITAFLEKCSDSLGNCGKLQVKVLDEEEKAVENAKVSLYDSETGFLALSTVKVSDVNGIARFTNLRKGKYYLRASKFPAEAIGNSFNLDPKKEEKQTVKLVIGFGTVIVNVSDATSGSSIDSANVEFRTETGIECGVGDCVVEADNTGRASIQLKADKKVFVIVSKQNYAPWVSQLYQVYPEETITVNAELERTILGTLPEIEPLGVFSSPTATKPLQELKAGKTYYAKFLLKLPDSMNASQAGVLLRTGTKNAIENDLLFISSVDVPSASQTKGTTWNPSKGQDTDYSNLTQGDAKWVSVVWNNPENGVYTIQAEIQVRNETVQGESLPIYYRAWALEGTKYLRDPEDLELGTGKETASKQELYASSKEQIYYEGQPALCDEEFCYSGEKVYDNTERLYLVDKSGEYTLTVFRDYTVSFNITNNSDALYNNSEIRIEDYEGGTVNDVLKIKSYKVTNADSQVFSNSLNDFEVSPISLGNFKKNTSVSGELEIIPEKEQSSRILIRIIADGSEVFRKEIEFDVISENSLSMEVYPDFFPAFIAFDANVLVKDEDGFEVEDAEIEVEKILSDGSETTVLKELTDSQGKIELEIPASDNKTIFRFKAAKEGYAPAEVEKTIDENILSFNPEKISSSLDPKSKTEENISLTAENKVKIPVTFSLAEVSGNFKGFLDEDKMNNFLQQYVGSLEIEGKQERDFTVKTALNSGVNITKTEKVKGQTYFQVTNSSTSKTWAFVLPAEVSISPGEAPTEDCLSISLREWSTVTIGDKAEESFEISNFCEVEGNLIELEDLSAKLSWNSNVIGNVQITLYKGNGETASEVLKEGTVKLFSEIGEEETLQGIISFTPKTGHEGETAKFSVEFSATTPTSSGDTIVEATNDIEADILIANLEQCISFSPSDGLTIDRSADDAEFIISTQDCGDIDLDIRFCQDSSDNRNCRGGTEEGGINIEPDTITNLNEDDRTVTVERTSIPGIYGMVVEARAPGKNWQKITTYDVEVEPDTGDYFWLQKYSFTVLGKGANDSTTLFNDRVVEPVAVTADLCAWEDASSDPNFFGTGALLIGGSLALEAADVGIATTAITQGGLSVASFTLIAGIILIALDFLGIFGDCHDETQTNTLYDYVINLPGSGVEGDERYLPPDAQAVMLDRSDLSIAWNLDTTNAYDSSGTTIQEVGVVFENLGLEQQEPVYSIGTFSATEHVHGDPTHSGYAETDCENGEFGNYWIGYTEEQGNCNGGTIDETYSEKIHLRFKTKETEQQLPEVDFDTYSCVSGSLIGRTGKGANPKIALNWSWIENTGITDSACDASNENAIYCDSTQFSIMLVKRLDALDEFLRENNYFEGICPLTSDQNALLETNNQTKTHTVLQNRVGVSSFSSIYSSGGISFSYTVQNNTSSAVDLNFDLNIYSQQVEGITITQSLAATPYKQEFHLEAGESKNGSTTQYTLSPETYQAVFALEVPGLTQTDSWNEYIGFVIVGEEDSGEYNCDIGRTTADLGGESVINQFIDSAESVVWTERIPDKQALNDLTKFDSLLIKDGYSDDFRQDFVEYYTNVNFADTPSYFTDKFRKYFESENMVFTNKYYDSDQLPSAGKYETEIEAYFGDDWRMFSDNEVAAAIGVTFYLLEEPKTDSVFYSMPIDGALGLEGTSYNRQGYGSMFENSNEELKISEEAVPVYTYGDSGSNSITSVETKKAEDLKTLNSDLTTRGNLLEVEEGENSLIYKFSPNYATPLILQRSISETTDEEFSVYYALLENQTPQNIGETLTYWSGAGVCVDFEGLPVTQAFEEEPDRQAESSDPISNWQTSYAVDWSKADYVGNVFLRTIFYTPRTKANSLQIVDPINSAELYTPDSSGTTVELNGISTMEHNRIGAGTTDSIDSLQDIFDLVDKNVICVTNTGVKERYFWNPKKVYEQSGSIRSVHVFTESLEAGNTCIGYT